MRRLNKEQKGAISIQLKGMYLWINLENGLSRTLVVNIS